MRAGLGVVEAGVVSAAGSVGAANFEHVGVSPATRHRKVGLRQRRHRHEVHKDAAVHVPDIGRRAVRMKRALQLALLIVVRRVA